MLKLRKIIFPVQYVYQSSIHYENLPKQYTQIFKVVKNENFQKKNFDNFSYFCSKHRLWVHGEAVLTSTHNLCFEAKIRKIGIPLQTPVFLYKSGV